MTDRTPFRHQLRVRFADTDASGRIHYTALFRFFEAAEIEFIRSRGLVYSPERTYSFPRVHAECDVMLGIVHDDCLEIEVSLGKLGRSSARLEFTAYKNEKVAAKGAVVVVCMDLKSQSSIPIPEEFREKLANA